jgi:hypothetical protein
MNPLIGSLAPNKKRDFLKLENPFFLESIGFISLDWLDHFLQALLQITAPQK